MPVRSLSSSVLRWPERPAVEEAVHSWAAGLAEARDEVLAVGYFGSYARGDWGVGSDVDLVVLVDHSDVPFERRGASFDTTILPVPAELVIYTLEEWDRLQAAEGFGRTIAREAVWVLDRRESIG